MRVGAAYTQTGVLAKGRAKGSADQAPERRGPLRSVKHRNPRNPFFCPPFLIVFPHFRMDDDDVQISREELRKRRVQALEGNGGGDTELGRASILDPSEFPEFSSAAAAEISSTSAVVPGSSQVVEPPIKSQERSLLDQALDDIVDDRTIVASSVSQAAAASAAAMAAPAIWECFACTYHNADLIAPRCEVCGTRRQETGELPPRRSPARGLVEGYPGAGRSVAGGGRVGDAATIRPPDATWHEALVAGGEIGSRPGFGGGGTVLSLLDDLLEPRPELPRGPVRAGILVDVNGKSSFCIGPAPPLPNEENAGVWQ